MSGESSTVDTRQADPSVLLTKSPPVVSSSWQALATEVSAAPASADPTAVPHPSFAKAVLSLPDDPSSIQRLLPPPYKIEHKGKEVIVRFKPKGMPFKTYIGKKLKQELSKVQILGLLRFLMSNILLKLQENHKIGLFGTTDLQDTCFIQDGDLMISTFTSVGSHQHDYAKVDRILGSLVAANNLFMQKMLDEFRDLGMKLRQGSHITALLTHPSLWDGPKKKNFILDVLRVMRDHTQFAAAVQSMGKQMFPNASSVSRPKSHGRNKPSVSLLSWRHTVDASFIDDFENNTRHPTTYGVGMLHYTRFARDVFVHGYQHYDDHKDLFVGINDNDMDIFLRTISPSMFVVLNSVYVQHFGVYIFGLNKAYLAP